MKALGGVSGPIGGASSTIGGQRYGALNTKKRVAAVPSRRQVQADLRTVLRETAQLASVLEVGPSWKLESARKQPNI